MVQERRSSRKKSVNFKDMQIYNTTYDREEFLIEEENNIVFRGRLMPMRQREAMEARRRMKL